MSFLVAAALGVAALALVPLLAHLLRRGQARDIEFPPANLVPRTTTTARQRRHLEDRLLLAVRVAMVVALAVLGATPLAKCERLSLARSSGASVALALVIDDSHSMRANLPNDGTRWERALSGARDLMASAREGDAVAILLAGKPARVALAATTDLAAAKEVLDELRPSDRSTDLAGAVQLARSILKPLPHVDKRLAVLSDLAGDFPAEGEPPVWTPLSDISVPLDNCAVVRADHYRQRVSVSLACSDARAAEAREVELTAEGKSEKRLGAGVLAARLGEQVLTLDVPKNAPSPLVARLTGTDALPDDDLAPVAEQSSELAVGVVVDTATASVTTGGPTVLEQALSALTPAPQVRPLPVVPDDAASYEKLAALLIDDPAGFPPETRAALSAFVRRGGIAVAFLGPHAQAAQLAATLEPFARGAVRWEETEPLGIDPDSMRWLGSERMSLGHLTRTGRVRLDGAEIEGAEVVGSWEDGRPFLLERPLERGVVVSVGLPVSVEASDWALRPAFLAFLDHVLKLAQARANPAITAAGVPWIFRGARRVTIEGPDGALPIAEVEEQGLRAVPSVVGRYALNVDGESEKRVVTLESSEILSRPAPPAARRGVVETSGKAVQVDVSRDVALIVLGLFTIELLLRALGRRIPRAMKTSATSEAS